MLTGYWPPTNEMLRRFSTDPVQNPDGWIGADWEGRGYNVYSFFPEFPHGIGKGEGDFEVDYQDTSSDFWLITDIVRPVALITFGRGGPARGWTLEWSKRNLRYYQWGDDYLAPLKPTPSPPDASVPAEHIRYSSLPLDEIVDAVKGAGLGIWARANMTGSAGAYLCEFVGYHATWYHNLHADPDDPLSMFSAGHIHVGSEVSIDAAIEATHVTLRTLFDYLDQPLVPYTQTISASEGGTIPFALNAGAGHALGDYVLLGGVSGTTPGVPLPGGAVLPLNWDWITRVILTHLDSAKFQDFMGTLDGTGSETALFNTLGPMSGGWAGITLYFAYALPYPDPHGWFASNPVDIMIVP